MLLGLGNPMLSDDAIGIEVARAVQRLLASDPLAGADVLCSTRAGFELIDLLQGYYRAVIVDALDVPEPVPGRVRELDLAGFAGSARLNNPHELSISTAFQLAARLGVAMPGEVLILGVECGEMHTFGEGMTPEVTAAIAPLAQRIHGLFQQYAQDYEPGDDDADFAQRRAFYSPDDAG